MGCPLERKNVKVGCKITQYDPIETLLAILTLGLVDTFHIDLHHTSIH